MSETFPENDPRVFVCPRTGYYCNNLLDIRGLGIIEKCQGEVTVLATNNDTRHVACDEDRQKVVSGSDDDIEVVLCGADIHRKAVLLVMYEALRGGYRKIPPIDTEAILAMASLICVQDKKVKGLIDNSTPKWLIAYLQDKNGDLQVFTCETEYNK